ncbi:glycosyltransferase family 87 protein [Streptomyces sp. NPDC048507]|uniref:glycosyltransferase family 87 protein n=1 Tax=Streptomyces sp. NPDC048507 TaxID=3365560 RepID=UPI00370FE434
MTRSPAPRRSPSPLVGVLVTGSLLVLGVLCVVWRIPAADALLREFSGAEWQPPAAYPPFAAILLTPASWLPAAVLKAVLVLGTGCLLALLILLSCRLGRLRARPGGVLALTIAGLWLEPLFQSPLPGQINLALACLALWDLGRPRFALGKGFALGVAAGITLTPAVFVPYLLVTGRVRAGLTALAGFAGTALLGLLVLPQASADFWARHLPATGPALLLDRSHLWVWCVPLLSVLAGALARRPGRDPGPVPGRPGTGPRTPPPAEGGVPAPRPPLEQGAGRPVSRSPAARRRP